jgi:hypothetical protein
MADLCGAKTRSGSPCRRAPLKGKTRCKLHGGASPSTNQNARKHGIYSAVLLPEEEELYESIAVGDLDQEIKMARLQLRRAMLAQTVSGGKPELDEFTAHKGKGSRGKPREEHHRVRNYMDPIQRLLGRIGDLELKRAQLLTVGRGGADDTPPPSAVRVTVEDATMTSEEIAAANEDGDI